MSQVSISGVYWNRSETGVLSSFVSYFSLSESSSVKGPTLEELEAGKVAAACVRDCQLDQLILDSKFLREDSLQELIKVGLLSTFVSPLGVKKLTIIA